MTGSYPNYLVVVLVLFGAVVACGCMASGGGDTTADRISGNGTITFVDLEGGFYGIVADDGRRYLPADLPAEYRQDGLRVLFSADVEEDGVGIHMWGTPAEIRSIERTDGVRLVSGNATVTYVDLEGGFYGLVADDGERYLPLNMNETSLVEGTNVTFVAEVQENTVTIQQWGVPVEVIAIDTAGNTTFVAKTGTVTYIDLEGGFYGIVADDGERYLPLNLNETYRVDGMRLTFVGELALDAATIQMWGTPVEIIDVPWACARCGGDAGIANPAAVWCTEQGHTYEIRKNPDGSEYGVCIFANATVVDAWDYYRQTH
ncbi:DUF333 domain-containing protein [Methanoculleus sp.]|jgi:putative hemolysin|uniref:putative hemolysin n=1 Tax=Methanoculleus sp. TaxID=90427 RepID=UPI001BD655B7|nr:DUF333 domain-containing protein [Methanoculleus sp.]